MDKIKEIRRFFLLQVNDALFPIGGYSHSQGLETYIQQGIVHDEETAAEYIGKKLKLNLACTDLLGVRLAYEYALKEDVAALDMLEEILGVSRIPMEQREASRKMGSRFTKTICKLPQENIPMEKRGIFEKYLERKTGESLLCLWSFLRSSRDRRGGNTLSLSLCPDLCNGDKLCKNHSAEPECGTETSLWMLWGV